MNIWVIRRVLQNNLRFILSCMAKNCVIRIVHMNLFNFCPYLYLYWIQIMFNDKLYLFLYYSITICPYCLCHVYILNTYILNTSIGTTNNAIQTLFLFYSCLFCLHLKRKTAVTFDAAVHYKLVTRHHPVAVTNT